MTEATTSKESKKPSVDLEYQKHIIDVVLHESEMLTLHPLIDFHPEIGLTHGVVFKNPKSERENDYRAVVIINKQVNFLARARFSAYGILAVACFAMLLYVTTSLSGRVDVGAPLLTIAGTIVAAFILYMFVKLVMSHRY